MVVCEQWLANDFLVRVGREPGEPCGCPDCPPVQPESEAEAEMESEAA